MDRGISKTSIVTLMITMLVLSAVGVMATTGDTSLITNSATIQSTCGIATNTSAINFGTLSPGDTSSEAIVQVNNTPASTVANFTIRGTGWLYTADNTSAFAVSQTKYDITTGTYASKTALTTSNVQYITNLAAGGSQNTFLQLKIPNTVNATGGVTQNVTLTVNC